jgi:ATP-dependent DNA helicase PIF1
MQWIYAFLVLSSGIYFLDRKAIKNKGSITQLITQEKPGEGIQLGEEQLRLVERLETASNHIFISGKAGSGKSVVLKYFKDNTKKQVVVLAPTGIAAVNVGGQTIHSFFDLKPGVTDTNTIRINSDKLAILRQIDSIVIDEISMVRADLVDTIDKILRVSRKSSSAFGGVQIIMFGDLFQLPPIVSDSALEKYFKLRYGGPFFYHARVWRKTSFKVYELNKLYRQPGKKFREILSAIRIGQIESETISELNQRAGLDLPGSGVITLAGTNKQVDEINQQKLDELKTRQFVFIPEVSGEDKAGLNSQVLRLKVGAQVMMTRNDPDKRWFNGSLARVVQLKTDYIEIKIRENVYALERSTWNKLVYSLDSKTGKISQTIAASISQYPLRLAWAITIHKSQGQTYERCAIDLKEGVFAHGQAYVALSRCRSLSGLYLLSPIGQHDIRVNPEILRFMKQASVEKI